MAKGCVECGVGNWERTTNKACATCFRKSIAQIRSAVLSEVRAKQMKSKPDSNDMSDTGHPLPTPTQLKVFRIIVYKQRKLSELVTDTIIVLATSEENATALVFSASKPHTYMVKNVNYHIGEIEGPFKEGSILYRTPQ